MFFPGWVGDATGQGGAEQEARRGGVWHGVWWGGLSGQRTLGGCSSENSEN